MKNRSQQYAILVLAVLFAAGCSTQPSQPTAPIDDRSTTSGAATTPGASTSGAGSGGVSGSSVPGAGSGSSSVGSNVLRDPNNILSKRSVFFDFDSFVVKSEYQPLVQAHGSYLGSNKSRRVIVEGHTDERGGREYNLALGQKRAEAVKQRLMLLGVTDSQIETVSFGEEKPRATGSTEEAWAQNRRADLNYR